MKKGDLIARVGKNRDWYENSYTPITRGEIVATTKDTVEIQWYDCKQTAIYPKADFEDTGRKKRHKDTDKEFTEVKIKKVRK